MKPYIFRLIVEEDALEDGRKAYHASAQLSKGCHAWGHTYLEALVNIREAAELYVEDLLEAGEAIPVDPEQGAGENFRNGLTDVSGCTLIRNRLEPHDEVRHASETRVRDVARSALRCLNPSRWVWNQRGPNDSSGPRPG